MLGSCSVLDSTAGVLRRNQSAGPEEWEGVFSWELEIQNKEKKTGQASSNDPDGVFVLMY